MAYKEVSYFCETCHKKFDKEKYANACENSHYTPTLLKSSSYDKDDKCEIPLSIVVEMSSKEGKRKTITYYRKL